MEKVIGITNELAEGERKIIGVQGKEIAVFIDGEYHTCVNWCHTKGDQSAKASSQGRQTLILTASR